MHKKQYNELLLCVLRLSVYASLSIIMDLSTSSSSLNPKIMGTAVRWFPEKVAYKRSFKTG